MGDAAAKAVSSTVSRVFLFFATSEIAELLAFTVESRFHCQAQSFFQAKAAVPVLKDEKFALAVLDVSLPEGMLVFEQVRTAKLPFVLFHPQGTSPDVRGPKIKAHKETELIAAVEEALRQVAILERANVVPGGERFARISPPLLLRVSPLPADVFIRLSTLRFVKLFLKEMTFDPDDAKTYHERRKIKHLYVSQDELASVAEAITASLESLLHQKRPKEDLAQLSVDTVETVHDLVRTVGFTPEVQKLVKANMDLVVKEMQGSPSLASVLANFERNKGRYIPAHSQLLAELSCAIAMNMEWGSDTSLKKISMASLLHDMCMTDHKLCAVKDMTELSARRGEFTLEQQEEYKNHTKRAALLIQGMKEVPADVDKIVYQHHELPRGTGFPEAIGHTHIHPLAATLMVAHDLVDWILDKPPGPIDVEAFAEAHMDKYSSGSFKKIMKAILKMKL